jgi:hypothetical protein
MRKRGDQMVMVPGVTDFLRVYGFVQPSDLNGITSWPRKGRKAAVPTLESDTAPTLTEEERTARLSWAVRGYSIMTFRSRVASMAASGYVTAAQIRAVFKSKELCAKLIPVLEAIHAGGPVPAPPQQYNYLDEEAVADNVAALSSDCHSMLTNFQYAPLARTHHLELLCRYPWLLLKVFESTES